jgi:predicted  nucleic acid-binding Zn-ribbon protein
MNEPTPLPTGDLDELTVLRESIKRISVKIQNATSAVAQLTQSRSELEGRIENAQKRVQRILNRLPEQNDGRQLNLLGETIPPTNPEDDSEPTTH